MKSYQKSILALLLTGLAAPLVCLGEHLPQPGETWLGKSQKEREKIWRVEMKNSLTTIFGGWRDAYLEGKSLWEEEEEEDEAAKYLACANIAANTHNRCLVRFKQVLEREGVKYKELPFIGPQGALGFVPADTALLDMLTEGMGDAGDAPGDRALAELRPAMYNLAAYRRYAKGGKKEKVWAADALLDYRLNAAAYNLWLSLVREANGDAYYYAPLPVMKVDSKY